MLYDLQYLAKKNECEQLELIIQERLPCHLVPPCKIQCGFTVSYQGKYYLINFDINSHLNLICQRCLKPFDYHYNRVVEIAVTDSEKTADEVMGQYECVVAKNFHVDFTELLTDELYFGIPECHLNVQECDPEVDQFLAK